MSKGGDLPGKNDFHIGRSTDARSRSMAAHAAGAFLLDGAEGIDSVRRAVGFVLEVDTRPKEVGIRWHLIERLLMVDRPLQLGAVNVPAVEGAGTDARGVDRLSKGGNGDAGQDPDDGHDDHDFDQGEGTDGSDLAVRFHALLVDWTVSFKPVGRPGGLEISRMPLARRGNTEPSQSCADWPACRANRDEWGLQLQAKRI